MKITIKYTNRKRKNKHGFMKRMNTKSGRAILSRRRKKGRALLSAQLKFSLSSSEFSHIMKTSKSLKIRDLSFKYISSSRPCLGFIVSKKYGGSIQRNLFKRRCRSLFKTALIDNKIYCSVVIRPNKQNVSLKSINESFALLYNQLLDQGVSNFSYQVI